MKKIILLLICLLLAGCSQDLKGTWENPGGDTVINFDDETVSFFGVDGSYEVSGDELNMHLGSKILTFQFEIKEDELILYLEDGKLILERQSE